MNYFRKPPPAPAGKKRIELPPLPRPGLERARRLVRELVVGQPTISVELYSVINEVGNKLIRNFTATFPRPGKNWGDPDVTAMRVMVAAALETAVTRALESVTAVKVPTSEPYPEDEITQPMDRPPHG